MDTDFCKKEEGIHRGLHAVMHLIEDHAQMTGIPVRFAASKILEGDAKILEQLKLTENEPVSYTHLVLLRQFMERADTLTPMEQIVLCHYAEGMDIKEVAEYECISIGTARKHNTNMNRKLGTTTYEELMLYIDLFRRCGRIDQLLKREKVEK